MLLEAAALNPETRTGGCNPPGRPICARPGHVDVAHHWGIRPLCVGSAPRQTLYEEYHPYGTSAYRSFGSSDVSAKRYRYTGKERDEETGLYYHGARYYMCWLARWASADPLGVSADGPGLYTYVRGSPVVLSDPSGMDAFDELVAEKQAQSNLSRVAEAPSGPSTGQKVLTGTVKALGAFAALTTGLFTEQKSAFVKGFKAHSDLPVPTTVWEGAQLAGEVVKEGALAITNPLYALSFFDPNAPLKAVWRAGKGAFNAATGFAESAHTSGRVQDEALGRATAGLLDVGTAFWEAFGWKKIGSAAQRETGGLQRTELSAESTREFVEDLTPFSGRTTAARNRQIDATIDMDLPGIRFTHRARYNPILKSGTPRTVLYGKAKQGVGTQVTREAFQSKERLIETLVHEELHHRYWARGLVDHHGPALNSMFMATVDRYMRLRTLMNLAKPSSPP